MSHTPYFTAPTAGPVGHALHHLTHAVRQDHADRRTASELARLDARLLDDIGVNPADVRTSLKRRPGRTGLRGAFGKAVKALFGTHGAGRNDAELIRLDPAILRDAGIDPNRVPGAARDLGTAVREADGLGAPLHTILDEAGAQPVRGYLSDTPSARRLNRRAANANRPETPRQAA